MSEYTAIFKCRLCGEIYKSGCTAGKKVAMNAAIGASQGMESWNSMIASGV